VYSNFIPKEGSNTYHGFFGARYAGEGWQSNNLDDEQRSRGLLSGSRINRIWDIDPALGGPILKDKAHFYFTIERDFERQQGQKRFPALAAPLAKDMLGAFTVNARNYFARGDYQVNSRNFLNFRMVLETAPTKGEGFNTNNATIDQQAWESDFDRLFSGSYTSVVSDRASNVIRVGNITERLNSGAQAFFTDDVQFVDAIPLGATGKILKTRLREQFQSYRLPGL